MLATPAPQQVTNVTPEFLSDAIDLLTAVVTWIEAQTPTSNSNVARARINEAISLLNS